MRLSFFAASAAAVTSAARQCVECVCVAFCNTAPWRTVVFVCCWWEKEGAGWAGTEGTGGVWSKGGGRAAAAEQLWEIVACGSLYKQIVGVISEQHITAVGYIN